MKVTIDASDFRKLEKSAKKIGGLAKKQITPAVRKAMRPVLADAKRKAPVDSGELQKGIVIKGEKSKVKLKKVYQVTMDAKKNDIFVKFSKGGQRSYYPASQEYGWKKTRGGKVQGKHYMAEAMIQNEDSFGRTVVSEVMKNVEKEWKKQHG